MYLLYRETKHRWQVIFSSSSFDLWLWRYLWSNVIQQQLSITLTHPDTDTLLLLLIPFITWWSMCVLLWHCNGLLVWWGNDTYWWTDSCEILACRLQIYCTTLKFTKWSAMSMASLPYEGYVFTMIDSIAAGVKVWTVWTMNMCRELEGWGQETVSKDGVKSVEC